jgi:hypothetical protein
MSSAAGSGAGLGTIDRVRGLPLVGLTPEIERDLGDYFLGSSFDGAILNIRLKKIILFILKKLNKIEKQHML